MTTQYWLVKSEPESYAWTDLVPGVEVEIRHPTSQQRMSPTQRVLDVEATHHRREALARLIHAQQLGQRVANGVDLRAGAGERLRIPGQQRLAYAGVEGETVPFYVAV